MILTSFTVAIGVCENLVNVLGGFVLLIPTVALQRLINIFQELTMDENLCKHNKITESG